MVEMHRSSKKINKNSDVAGGKFIAARLQSASENNALCTNHPLPFRSSTGKIACAVNFLFKSEHAHDKQSLHNNKNIYSKKQLKFKNY
jgi:hypothetical protein